MVNSMIDPIESRLLLSDPDCIDIVAKYVAFLPGRLKEIRNAIIKDDLIELKRLVHDLKGVSGGMGYPQVTELCDQLEREVQIGGVGSIKESILKLDKLNEGIRLGFTG